MIYYVFGGRKPTTLEFNDRYGEEFNLGYRDNIIDAMKIITARPRQLNWFIIRTEYMIYIEWSEEDDKERTSKKSASKAYR